MNGSALTIEGLVNNEKIIPILADTGCDCYAAISEKLARQLDLPRIPTRPRVLREATSTKGSQRLDPRISEIAYLEIDLEGFSQRIYGYVVPGLNHSLILGKPWFEKHRVVYDAEARELLIRSQGGFRIRDIEAAKSSFIEPPKEIGAASIRTLIRRVRRS